MPLATPARENDADSSLDASPAPSAPDPGAGSRTPADSAGTRLRCGVEPRPPSSLPGLASDFSGFPPIVRLGPARGGQGRIEHVHQLPHVAFRLPPLSILCQQRFRLITLPAQARQQPEMIRIQLPPVAPAPPAPPGAPDPNSPPDRSAHGTRASMVLSGIAPPVGSSRASPSGSGPHSCGFERYRARFSTPAPAAAPAPGTPHPSARSSSRTDAPDSGPPPGASTSAPFSPGSWLPEKSPRRSGPRPQQVGLLGRILEPRSGVALDGSLRRLAGYVNLELRTSQEDRFHRIYSGIHSARKDRVILHLYDLSASKETNVEVRSRREHEALHRLQRYSWAPRILDSYQPAPGYTGEMYFFTVVDPAAPSIEKRASDRSWDTTARLVFARNAIHALDELHHAGMDDERIIHRNLTRETVLVKYDNSPILTGFERTRIPTDISVAPATASVIEWGDTIAPEVCAQGLGAADHRSDAYSLCRCLAGLFRDVDDLISRQVMDVLNTGMAEEPAQRSTLRYLEAELAALLGESVPLPSPPEARFWTEDQVVRFGNHHYRIVGRLGSGGVGTTFKVIKINPSTQEDLGTYVGKVVHDRDTGQRVLRTYELVHSHLRHSALSTIFEVASEWQDNNFVALMTWVEGRSLHDFAGVLPLLAEDLHEESNEALILRWLQTACHALEVLHSNGLVHGDVSPRNMIVSGGDLVLTDYDFAGRIGEPAVGPGTIMYCSPSYLDGRPAEPADDIYALAMSFFHVLFEKTPCQYDGDQGKERGLNWKGVERDEYPTVAAFLDLATNPSPEQRFSTVADALTILSPSPSIINQDNLVNTSSHGTQSLESAATPPTGGTGRTNRERSELA